MKRHDYYVVTCESGSKLRILLYLPESTEIEAQKEAEEFFEQQGDGCCSGSLPIMLIGQPLRASRYDIPQDKEPIPYKGVGTVWLLPVRK